MPRRQTGGKGKNKHKKYKPKKQNKSKPKPKSKPNPNEKKNVNYSPQMIEKLAKEIRVMIAKNDDEAAMNKINIIQQNFQKTHQILPLILNSLKCVILAQCQDYDALKLLFCEINSLFLKNKYESDDWNNESLNCLQNACQISGEIHYLLIFLESAFNSKKIIKNENRCRELYFTYFINAKYNKLSQLATKMNRGFNSNSNSNYNMWAITGAVIDIDIDIDGMANNNRDTILKLQQLQFERQYLNNTSNDNCNYKEIDNFDALMTMYYKILSLRKEYAKLNQFIESDVIRIAFTDKNKLLLWKLECFLSLNQWSEVNRLCAEMLFNDKYNNLFVDDWEVWTNWIKSQFIIYGIDGIDGIESILDIQEKHNKFGGAYLSEIEFNLKLIQFNDTNDIKMQQDANQDKLIKLIIKYFKHFANKNVSCFNDIKKYLNYINGKANKKKLIRDIKQLQEEKNETHSHSHSLKRYNVLNQIELYFGENLLIEKVQMLYNKWHSNININKNMIKTDETDTDELILIAVNILLHLSESDRDRGFSYIMDCILLLELGLIRSEYNFRLRLYLLRLYCHPLIGNICAAYNAFLSMNIRGFQYDSLSHLLFHDASRYGFISKIFYLHKAMQDHRREFNIANLRRTPQCFAYNNYHKVIETAQFNYAMRKSEMFIISQTDFIFCKLTNYYIDKVNMNINMNIICYLETFILPNHPYLNNIIQEEEEKNEEEYDGLNIEEWRDLNDYTTIPMYIDERKENYCHKLIKYPPISTLSNDYLSDYDDNDKYSKQTKKCHIFLLLLYIEMLYKSLTNNIENVDKNLGNLWNLMKKLKFVKCEILINEIKNILNICNLCDSNNFHWILVFCFHWLNKMFFSDIMNNENITLLSYNLEIICDKFVLFTDNLSIMINKEGRTKNGLNGIHSISLWRFISILSFTTFTLFKHWINRTKETNPILNKLIIKKYNLLSKTVEKLRRILCEILTDIESQFKIINIAINDEILKQYHIRDIVSHESNINMDENIKNKTKLKQIKIAMININNNVVQNNIDILKQNILILKQLRVL